MNKLIDTVCPQGHIAVDVWVMDGRMPRCWQCGAVVERAWLSAPAITPQGTRRERNTDKPAQEARVDTQAIARETTTQIQQRWATYGSEVTAEQCVGREVNHAAGITDTHGNPLPMPTPEPLTFKKPALADCAI